MPPTRNASKRKVQHIMAREILGLISDKWTLLIMLALDGKGEMRFSDLHRTVGPVSQKMLAQTLRKLEKDGLVTRRIHPTVPPKVDYRLTRLGESLSESTCSLWLWVGKHKKDIEKSRESFSLKKLTITTSLK